MKGRVLMTMSLFDEPRARSTDPATSHRAAELVRPVNSELIEYSHAALARGGLLTHEEIADAVDGAQPDRWTRGTIVSACARAGLFEWDETVTNKRGHTVRLWSLEPPEENVRTIDLGGDVL